MAGRSFLLRGGEALAHAIQRSCGCPLPGGVQDQDSCSPEQPELVPDLVSDNHDHSRWLELDGL